MGIFKVLQDFRALVEAIRGLVSVMRELRDIQREAGPALDRLNALELTRHQFEAEMQGVLLKADGKLKAANNAEARERQLKKSYEKQLDPLALDLEEAAEAEHPVLAIDAATSEREKLHALRLDVAANPKAAALNHKFGR